MSPKDPEFDWEETQEPNGTVIAALGGTRVMVSEAKGGSPGPWKWEVHFADGQVQVGYAEDLDVAVAKGKKVAERFLT